MQPERGGVVLLQECVRCEAFFLGRGVSGWLSA